MFLQLQNELKGDSNIIVSTFIGLATSLSCFFIKKKSPYIGERRSIIEANILACECLLRDSHRLFVNEIKNKFIKKYQ